jgi:hypothetical protein
VTTATQTEGMTAEERDRLAQETAEHIAGRRSGPNSEGTFGTPPRTIPVIKGTLLDGHVWISWLDDTVTAAMRRLHGEPGSSAAFLVEGAYDEPVRVTGIGTPGQADTEHGRVEATG